MLTGAENLDQLAQLYTIKPDWNLKVSSDMMIVVDHENEQDQKRQVAALKDLVLNEITEYGKMMKEEQDELKEKKIN